MSAAYNLVKDQRVFSAKENKYFTVSRVLKMVSILIEGEANIDKKLLIQHMKKVCEVLEINLEILQRVAIVLELMRRNNIT